MSAVIIAKLDDAARLSTLHGRAFSAHEAWGETAFADLLVLASTLALMIEGQGGLAGLLLIQKTPDDAEILTLAVDPAARCQGHARTMIAAGAQILGQSGRDRFILDVAADNRGAIALYRTLGFTEDTRRRNYYSRPDAKRVDAILMSRPLARQTKP